MAQPVSDPDLLRILNGGDAPAQHGGPVYGTPAKPDKPDAPKTTWRTLSDAEAQAQGLPAGKQFQVNSEGKVEALPGGDIDPVKTERQRADSLSTLTRVINQIDEVAFDAADNNGWFETGGTGSFSRKYLPDGTAAYDLASNIKMIDANSAFSKLQEMRDNSPTGGALGQVTERELDLLKSSIASIDPNQSQATFFSNLAKAKRAYLDMLRRLDPAEADAYKLKRGIRFKDDGGANLVFVDGPDDREPEDRFNTLGGPSGPNGGGPSGGPDGGLTVNPNGPGGLLTLAKQGLTLGLNDEAAGLGGYIGAALTGRDPSAAYARERDLERRNVAASRQAWPVMGTAAEFLGGGAAAKGLTVPNSLAQVVRPGAGMGGIAGFGYGEGGDSVPNALLGVATGGALGAGLYGAGRGINALARPRGGVDTAVIEAGQRQNIPVRQPDARPELRGRYAAAESGQTSGPVIRQTRANDAAAMEGRVAEIGGQGNHSDPYALGSRVQEAGKRYIAKTRKQADALYRRAEQAAGGATVTARNADAVLDANIQELRAAGETSNSAAIKYLEGLRSDIDRGLSLGSVQNLRTNMRGQIGQHGLTGTDTERRVGQVIDAMTQDLAEQLPAEASQALRAADAFYRDRQSFINDTLKQFMGSRGNPLPAETAASRLVSMTQGRGNFERFSRMWGQLDDAERADVSATVAASLGRSRNGEFSPAALVQSLDPAKGINPRTAALIFGREGAEAMKDLRILAAAKRDAMDRMSPSGQAITGATGGLKTLLMGAFGFSAGGPAGAVAGGMVREFVAKMGEQRTARMLLNPDFTKWLRAAPNTTRPQVIDRYFAKLGTIGSIAANDNAAFLGAIRRAFGGPGAAAAEDEQKAVGVPPQQ